MSLKVITFLLIPASFGFGYVVGNMIGKMQGYKVFEKLQKNKGLNELKSELKEVGRTNILTLVDVSAEIRQTNEGGLFRVKYAHYLYGKISNASAVAAIKDIRLSINFFSKTNTLIAEKEIMVYEFILPGQSYDFREKLEWPKDADTYTLSVLDARVD